MKYLFILLSVILINTHIYSQPPDYTKIKFSHFVRCSSVKDQQNSSTCWSFAIASFLESEIYKNQGFWLDIAEMYFVRYSFVNKINAYLKAKGKIYFTPGGQFHDVVEVIKTKGIVLEENYHGDPMGTHFYNHDILDSLVFKYTKELLKLGRKTVSKQDWIVYNKIFKTYLGADITNFNYGYKSYTPIHFNSKFLKIKPDDYIEITSYTHHPFYAPFVLEDKYNWMKKKYYNVPLNDFIQITDSALLNGYSVCWNGDVTEKTFDYDTWAAYLEKDVKANQETRQQMYMDTTSKLDHVMHIIGIKKDDKNKKWYYIKNSWGKGGPNLGYITMSTNYFILKTIAIVVNKNAIPIAIKKKMKL